MYNINYNYVMLTLNICRYNCPYRLPLSVSMLCWALNMMVWRKVY